MRYLRKCHRYRRTEHERGKLILFDMIVRKFTILKRTGALVPQIGNGAFFVANKVVFNYLEVSCLFKRISD